MDLKSLLNKEQYEGAVTVDGPVLILAGAGSGKTRVLTYRMAHMIEDLNIFPYKILAITFTNKAAKEMQERVQAIIGDKAKDMWISTFHSTCVRILRREIEKLGYKKNFTIYDGTDQKTLIKECIKILQINDKEITEQEIMGKISKAKDNMQSADSYYREHESNFREKKIAEVYKMYQKRLKENNALDFDDLICKTVELFKKDPETLEFYQRKFQYIMVDEYQDTNGAQYELVTLLAAKHRNLCVVGDDDQCLVEGTLITTKDGTKKIEDLKCGDNILVAAGNGETAILPITDISKKQYTNEVIKVRTVNGKVIKSIPNHLTFGKVALEEDKIWVIKVCDSKEDATYYEQYYAIKYGIPTAVFNARGRNIVLSQEKINKMFEEINTVDAAERLMEEEYLYKEYPHHLCNAVIRGNSVRKRVNISFFAGKKSIQRGLCSHRIGLNSSGEEAREKFVSAGFNVRNGERNTYRVETERALYDEAEEFTRRALCSCQWEV